MRTNKALWVVQGMLALLFLFAGSMKLVLPIEAMAGPVVLPGWFLRFLGVAEVCGAVGLLAPGMFRVHVGLTPLAASGLTVIMVGATALTWATSGVGPAAVPFVVGCLAILIAIGRIRLAPMTNRANASAMTLATSTGSAR